MKPFRIQPDSQHGVQPTYLLKCLAQPLQLNAMAIEFGIQMS
ncbi:hypothetical protein CFT9_04731 [Pseudomonas sp. CFT9]|nr:hypothetical protein CFT9_04731 [Pseudomonas sp. CFT9]